MKDNVCSLRDSFHIMFSFVAVVDQCAHNEHQCRYNSYNLTYLQNDIPKTSIVATS